jgi:glycosyltransferase involved in cell wall biosynthesis
MSHELDVSVVISTFNRSTLLTHAVRGLVEQEVPSDLRYEIIVVDNNSSDNTREVIEAFEREHGPRVRYVFEPRQGVSFGRNAGISAARAPVVAFTDDDNVVDSTWVATLKDALDRHPDAAAVGGPVLPEWPAKVPRWLERRHWSPLAILDYGETPFYTSAADPRCLLTANLAVRRDVFARIGAFSPDFPRCQDHELMLRLWQDGGRVLYLPKLVVRTHIAPERLTRRYHRAWHRVHGAYSAVMAIQEIINADGTLRHRPADAPKLFGTPGFVYREMAVEACRCVAAVVRLRRSSVQYHADRVSYFSAYIRRRAADTAPLHKLSMRVSRIMGVHLLMVLLVGGAAYDIVTGTEHWPFSPYPMFSTVAREPIAESVRVMGVTDEPVPREIPLRDRRMVAPFDQCRLSTVLAGAVNNPARRPLAHEMLRDCLDRYEAQRASGRHDGPPLQAVRLYKMTWNLDPAAVNVDRPERARLLEEVRADAKH